MRSFSTFPTILAGCVLACAFTFSSLAADFYVDASSGPGGHAGTMEDPFALIADALDIAVSGDTVHVATGTYQEILTVPDGTSIRGGYSQDWLYRDPDAWPTVIDGGGDEYIVTGVGSLNLDGLTIQNGGNGVWSPNASQSTIEDCFIRNITGMDGSTGSFGSSGRDAHGIYLIGGYIVIDGCRIDMIRGGDGGSASEPGGESGWGGAAYGIRLMSEQPNISNCMITQIFGGNGGNGINNHCHGGAGGTACAIHVDSGGSWAYLPRIIINEISTISGGHGGNGGVEWDYAGDSGDGGDAIGILLNQYNKAGVVELNHLSQLSGGFGGYSPWAHLSAGNAGNGGHATGIQISGTSDTRISVNIILSVTGGNGGPGGTAGDFPGCCDSTSGGAGGAARAIHDSLSEGNTYLNNLADHITGGDGDQGGAPMMTTSCSSGGAGGLAAGIDIENGGHFVQFNTVTNIQGGERWGRRRELLAGRHQGPQRPDSYTYSDGNTLYSTGLHLLCIRRRRWLCGRMSISGLSLHGALYSQYRHDGQWRSRRSLFQSACRGRRWNGKSWRQQHGNRSERRL